LLVVHPIIISARFISSSGSNHFPALDVAFFSTVLVAFLDSDLLLGFSYQLLNVLILDLLLFLLVLLRNLSVNLVDLHHLGKDKVLVLRRFIIPAAAQSLLLLSALEVFWGRGEMPGGGLSLRRRSHYKRNLIIHCRSMILG
jgi:hypothetical protein